MGGSIDEIWKQSQIKKEELSMNKNNPTDVSAAFELLLEEVEIEINSLDKMASRASEEHDRKSAREALELADQITSFRDKVVSLRKEWETLAAAPKGIENKKIIPAMRSNMGRLQRGMRTPEEAFYHPILKVLDESGGSARISDLMAKLEPLMSGVLKQVDYEPLASQPETPRWNNTAHWARNSMAKEGLLKSNSPRGVWEITEAGRKYLAEESR
jgi:restriction system protein